MERARPPAEIDHRALRRLRADAGLARGAEDRHGPARASWRCVRDAGKRSIPRFCRRLLTRAFEEVTAAVEAHGGTIETTTGDAVTAVFGLPVVHEDDPLRATRAADEIQRRLADGEEAAQLAVRIGVSTGPVFTGGDPTRHQLRATGEPLTTSARLALEAEPGETALDDATRKIHGSGASARSLSFARWSVAAANAALARRVRAGGRRQLVSAVHGARDGRSRKVEARPRLSRGHRCTRAHRSGRCLPYGDGITFWPLLEAVKDLAELDDTATG